MWSSSPKIYVREVSDEEPPSTSNFLSATGFSPSFTDIAEQAAGRCGGPTLSGRAARTTRLARCTSVPAPAMGERSEKLERLIAGAKARHGNAVREISMGFGSFEARLAKEPKVIHEQVHRHHKLQLKGNNLWGESSFDAV